MEYFFKSCNPWIGIICNTWPLDGSPKNFNGTAAWRDGTLQSCLACPGRAYEQSVSRETSRIRHCNLCMEGHAYSPFNISILLVNIYCFPLFYFVGEYIRFSFVLFCWWIYTVFLCFILLVNIYTVFICFILLVNIYGFSLFYFSCEYIRFSFVLFCWWIYTVFLCFILLVNINGFPLFYFVGKYIRFSFVLFCWWIYTVSFVFNI